VQRLRIEVETSVYSIRSMRRVCHRQARGQASVAHRRCAVDELRHVAEGLQGLVYRRIDAVDDHEAQQPADDPCRKAYRDVITTVSRCAQMDRPWLATPAIPMSSAMLGNAPHVRRESVHDDPERP